MRTGWQFLDWAQFVCAGVSVLVGLLSLASAPKSAFLVLLLGVFMFLLPVSRRNSFNHGWMSGRVRMVAALYESAQRGHTLDDWLLAEAERDVASLPASYRKHLP